MIRSKLLVGTAVTFLSLGSLACSKSEEPAAGSSGPSSTVLVPTGAAAGTVALTPKGEYEAFCKDFFAVVADLRRSGSGDAATFERFQTAMASVDKNAPDAIKADLKVSQELAAKSKSTAEILTGTVGPALEASNRLNEWATVNCGADPRKA